jgi:hypothetical protein
MRCTWFLFGKQVWQQLDPYKLARTIVERLRSLCSRAKRHHHVDRPDHWMTGPMSLLCAWGPVSRDGIRIWNWNIRMLNWIQIQIQMFSNMNTKWMSHIQISFGCLLDLKIMSIDGFSIAKSSRRYRLKYGYVTKVWVCNKQR